MLDKDHRCKNGGERGSECKLFMNFYIFLSPTLAIASGTPEDVSWSMTNWKATNHQSIGLCLREQITKHVTFCSFRGSPSAPPTNMHLFNIFDDLTILLSSVYCYKWVVKLTVKPIKCYILISPQSINVADALVYRRQGPILWHAMMS